MLKLINKEAGTNVITVTTKIRIGEIRSHICVLTVHQMTLDINVINVAKR